MQNTEFWKSKISKEAVLSPIDRTSEVLFGLIMVLTFTGAISASSDGREEISSLLWAALGCNVAWGLVDAIMYLMNVLFERGYSRNIFIKIRKSKPGNESLQNLKEELQPIVSELLSDDQLRQLETKIRELPDAIPIRKLLSARDFYSAFLIFLLVFLCTLPVSLPFGIISDPGLALRVSNGIALVMLFLGGYNLARHAGFNPLLTAIVYMFIGVVLVAVTYGPGGMSKKILVALIFCVPVFAMAQDTTSVEPKWEGSAELNFYFLQDDFFVLPVLSFDKNWLHLEARYNYEDKKTTSIWGGYNFSGGNKLEYEFTPMIGFVAGELNGFAPGLETTIGFHSFELYSESEYYFDFNTADDNYFYTWTDLTWSPVEWAWIGISGQRTRLYETDVDIQNGLLAGGGFRGWELSGYFYNPGTQDWFFITSISWSF